VTRHGKIDGVCEGKDAWDGAIRLLAPQVLNMAVVKVIEQDPINMARLRLQLDGKFENLSGELSVVGFRDCVRRFMKGERARLKEGMHRKVLKPAHLEWTKNNGTN